jgi:flagellar basal-body rod modification protein FlgD
MSAAELHKSSHRVASGLVAQTGKGLSTSATSTLSKAPSVAATRAAATGAASTSTSSSSDITSNDFLTLLVTEMQNQDPTQPTDPNAYIQQLVGVNSLQQLISINQELGAASSGSTSSGGSGGGTTGGSSGSAQGITPIGVASTPVQSSVFTSQPTTSNS